MIEIIETAKQVAIERYSLDLKGLHALDHWERVKTNGLFLAKWNDADKLVVELFAVA